MIYERPPACFVLGQLWLNRDDKVVKNTTQTRAPEIQQRRIGRKSVWWLPRRRLRCNLTKNHEMGTLIMSINQMYIDLTSIPKKRDPILSWGNINLEVP